jgi:hypothetical protein
VLALALAASACSNHHKIVIADSSPDGVTPGSNVVTLQPLQPPAFIAYRDGKGPWQTPVKDSRGNYTLNVTHDYQWVIVCTSGADFDAELQGATFSDGASQFAFCFAYTPPATVSVTGQMVQAGSVMMTDTATSTTPAWAFNLNVPTGPHELVAIGGNRMVIRRGEMITAATALPPIDVATQGTAMTPLSLTVNNLGSDTLGVELDLFTGNDIALMNSATTMLQAPPASLLLASDSQDLFVSASGAGSQRDAFATFTGTETSFALPPVLTGVTYAVSGGDVSATWGALPSYTDLKLMTSGSSTTAATSQTVTASKSWIAETGATQLVFDAAPPGYDPAWKINTAGPYIRELFADDNSGSILYSSAVVERVNGAVARESDRARQRTIFARATSSRSHFFFAN